MAQRYWKLLSVVLISKLILQETVKADSNGLGDLAKILAQLAGGHNCVFRCPKGKYSRVKEI